MTVPPARLTQALAAFDDAALEALASRGLVRRARRDLESDKVAVAGIDDDGVTVRADGEEVRIGPEGPAAASCTCKATGVCRHRLAATLLLRARSLPERGRDDQSASAGESATPEPLAELLAIPRADLDRWAGRATMRAAEEMLAGAEAKIRPEGQALVITLGDAPAVRFLAGQGLDGVISKAPRARRKALHAAAILAVRRAHGEAAPAAVEPPAPERPDVSFLAAIRAGLTDCLRTGFNQAPLALEERLFALSVSSRADAQPRLAALVRALSARVRARRERDFTLDAESSLALLAEAHALVRALEGVASGSVPPARMSLLAGSVRQSYAELGELTLFGVGAERWRTEAGAHGVTGHFYAPDAARWFSASLARAHGRDVSFEPRAAFESQALWQCASLATLSTGKVTLTNAAASPDGRLSLAARVTAQVEPWHPLESARGHWPCVHDDWSALETTLRTRFAQSLGTRAGPEPVLLAPARCAMPFLDELGQQVVWPVADREGRWIGLTMEHRGEGAEAIALEQLARDETAPLVATVCLPERARFRLRPFAVWVTGRVQPIVSITLLPSPAPSASRQGRLLRRLGRTAAAAVGLSASGFEWSDGVGATGRSLASASDALLAVAELGGWHPGSSAEALDQLAGTMDSLALEPVALALRRIGSCAAPDRPARVLDAVYVVEAARSLERRLPDLRPG